jgi:UDP-N-acetylenolpyruvoylglucosamine reductase
MPFQNRLTEADKAHIIMMAIEGYKTRDILKAIDNRVTRQRVSQILRSEGIKTAEARKLEQNKLKDEHLNNRYGSFFRDGTIDSNKELISLARAKFRAKKRNAGAGFTVDFKDIEWKTHCPILGMELNYKNDGRCENSPSFDRLDNNKGYVPGNVIIVSWRANRIKNDGTAEEHRLISNFMLQNMR